MKTAKLKYRIMELIDNELVEPYYNAMFDDNPSQPFRNKRFDSVEKVLKAIEDFANITCVDLNINIDQFEFVIISTVEIE